MKSEFKTPHIACL